MRTQKPRAVGLLLVFAATVTMLQTTSPAQASGTDSAQYFAQMNQERADHGLAALAWRSDLADIAQRWAQHMSSTHELAHNPNLARQVQYWQVVGESVGDRPSRDDLDRAF